MNEIVVLAAPFVGLAACGLCHLVSANVLRHPRTLPLLIGSFSAGAIVCTASAACAGGDAAPLDRYVTIVTATLTYGGLAYCYVNFVNVGIASLRVRVLTEMAMKPEGISRAALVAEYGAREVVGARLKRLEQAGQLTARSGRFYHRLAPIYFLAVGLSALKQLILGVRWGRNLD